MASTVAQNENDLKVRKITGHGLLGQNRLQEALDVYLGILRDYPNDLDAYLVLGDLYIAAEDYLTAYRIYKGALTISPDNPDILRRINLAGMETSSAPPETVPTDPAAIKRLLQKLIQSTEPVCEEEIERAAELLSKIIHSPEPAEMVSRHLDQIDSMLPALLELNIRQARADGRPELAAQLHSLKRNIELRRASAQKTQPAEPGSPAAAQAEAAQARVVLLVSDSQNPGARASMAAEALSGSAVKTTFETDVQRVIEQRPDVVITWNPHASRKSMEAVAALHASGIRVIWDMDLDIEHLTLAHPEYERLGLGSQDRARAYAAALLLVDSITVPNVALASVVGARGYPVDVIPDRWSKRSPFWQRPDQKHSQIHVGWMSQHGQMEDLAPVRRMIIRVLRAYPQVQLVIVGDAQAYQMFESVAENQRMFIPEVPGVESPYILSQLDLLLVPLRNIPFNQTRSDRALMEAGAARLAWIASPISAYQEWSAGGLIARTPEDWHTYLRQLVIDDALRRNLAQQGWKKAATREAVAGGEDWAAVIERLVQ